MWAGLRPPASGWNHRAAHGPCRPPHPPRGSSTAAAVSAWGARRVRGHPGDVQPVQPRKPGKLRNAREQRELWAADSDPEPRLPAAYVAVGVPDDVLKIGRALCRRIYEVSFFSRWRLNPATTCG